MFFTVGFARLFVKGVRVAIILSELSVKKEKGGLLELAVALRASGRVQITWETALKVRCRL